MRQQQEHDPAACETCRRAQDVGVDWAEVFGWVVGMIIVAGAGALVALHL